MTVKYYAILTNQGAARLANATMLGSKLNLTRMAVGDANGVLPTPDPAQTKLINQKRIAPLNLLSVDPNNQSQIIAEQIIPESEGGFWIREIGLYDDKGVLIAVANCPETYKPQLQEGSGRTQTIRMILVVTNTEAITLKIDPSVVLATRKYVDDKISEHEQSRRHPDASLTAKGFVQLSSATNSTSETLAATPKAVKAAYDLANGKYTAQDATTARKGLVQLSSATNSTSETLAATPKAVKAAYDLANGKYTAQDATTARKGLVQLSSATNSTSETLAATPKAVKAAYDLANGKYTAQDATTARKGLVQLSSATNSTSETLAATPKAVKAAYDLANGKYTAQDATTARKGLVQLSSATNSTSETLAATPKAVKAAYDLANGKQPADATLTALAGLATAADRLPYFTGADRAALATLTAIGRAIIAKGSIKDVLNYLGLGEGSALPVGVPVPWPTATPPAGWLKCDGRAFTKEQYPVLARAYPTLRLPDLRGEFIRGWDDGRKVDTRRSLLSGQAATFIRTALQDYYGYDLNTNVKVGIAFATADSVITVGNPANPKAGNNSDYVPASADNSIMGTQRTAEDNFTGAWISMRPRNVAFNYIVRAA
ncbi:phage tail fiber repeat family protein [Escherichia coli 5-366-08_S4_C1]|uniref:tail fiber protein n=32 Tax=Escherichia coli TaxID=562 RepID=UPI0004D7F6EF|nr:phage tail fiber repeat family protein [Escherichia coli 5-366-08_S4_C1]